jgi:hypothetical protein
VLARRSSRHNRSFATAASLAVSAALAASLAAAISVAADARLHPRKELIEFCAILNGFLAFFFAVQTTIPSELKTRGSG